MSHMPRGYIVVSRCLRDHKLVGIRSGNTGFWLDILLRSAGLDGYQGLKRGEVRLSLRVLAKDWGVSVKVVRNFLAKLQEQNMLQKGAHPSPKKGTHEGTVYVVVNYEKYQENPGDRAQPGAHPSPKKGTQRNTVENTLKEKDLTVFVAEPAQVDLEEAIATREVSDAQKVVNLWNDLASKHGLTQVKVLNDARRKSINARIKDAGGLDGVKDVIDYIGSNPVLLGKQKFGDGRTWKADFEYLVRPTKFVANLEKAQAEKAKAVPVRKITAINPDDLGW